MGPQRDVDRRRRLLLALAAAVVLGVLGMHGLSLHAGHAMADGPVAGGSMTDGSMAAHHEAASSSDQQVAMRGEAMAPMLCALMLAGGVLLLLRRPARGVLGRLAAVVLASRAVPARALQLPGAHGPPPPPWRHSVVRC